MTLGLRWRVGFTVGVISLLVATLVGGSTYLFARYYLSAQREAAAVNRALVNTQVVDAALLAGSPPSDALALVPISDSSQPMLQSDGVWFTAGVTISPDQLPASTLEAGQTPEGGRQRVNVGGDPFIVVAKPAAGGTYVEVFPLAELDRTLRAAGLLLGLTSLAAFVGGTALGRFFAGRALRPVLELGEGARRIASGDTSARVRLSGDADVDPISVAFNDMADAVEDQLDRERRFSANVSHELRSPLTALVGTADLLVSDPGAQEGRTADLARRINRQVRRFSTTLVDLLEIAQTSRDADVLPENISVNRLIAELLVDRGLDPSLLSGDEVALALDGRRVERVIGNLIDNAQTHGEGLRAILVEQLSNGCRVLVDDAGTGVPEEERAQVFEPFTRGAASSSREGAGLGLAIATEQCRLLGASLSIDSSPQGGARFVLTLVESPPPSVEETA